MRTQEEIVARILERREHDILGFETSEYLDFIDYAHAKPFLKPEASEPQWNNEVFKEAIKENILEKMLDYMSFAWEKANDCRGISANRSICHYCAWLWLMDDGFYDKFNSIEYEHYGKEMLMAICENYGWDWKQWDDGRRTNYG